MITGNHRCARLLAATSVTALTLGCGSALAAQGADATNGGEVVVTARLREETLQKVPAQVTAFTARTIEAKGIEMPRDFIQAVPNVSLVETQNAGTSFVVIRGISQARNSEPSVAVVVDGVPETQPAQFNQELVDIQQIEVLKGPQGALYGRNAIGGAILITTKQPTDHWEGRVTAGYESGPGGKGQAVISGPLSDTLGMRAAISYVNTSGHIENTFLHQKADPVSDLNGRLTLVYKPNDKFSADLRLAADRLWTQALYYNIVYYAGLSFLGTPPYTTLTTPDVNNTSLPVQVNNPGKNNRAIYDASLKMNYETEQGTFTSISGYNLTKEILTGDAFDFLPPAQSLLNVFAGFDQNQSQFLRVRTLTRAPLHLAVPEPVPLDRGRPDLRHQALHLDRQRVGHRPRRGGDLLFADDTRARLPRIHAQPEPPGHVPRRQPEQLRLGGLSRHLDRHHPPARVDGERPVRPRPPGKHHRHPDGLPAQCGRLPAERERSGARA